MAIGVPFDDDTVTNGGSVNLLYGTASGPDAPSMTTLRFDQDTAGVEGAAETGDTLGVSLAYGDFDGDGYDDLGIGASGEGVGSAGVAGAVNILYGTSSGLSATADQIWHGDSTDITLYNPSAGDSLGFRVTAGDFDGDGYDDLAMSMVGYDAASVSNAGGVLILYGSVSGLSATGHQVLHQATSGMAGDGNQSGDGWGGEPRDRRLRL